MGTVNTRFVVKTNATGCIMILDSSKAEGQDGRAVAHFFMDKSKPGKAGMLAEMCAKHLNAEAMRRVAKTAEQGTLTDTMGEQA